MSHVRPSVLRVIACVFLFAGLGFWGDLITRVAAQRAAQPGHEAGAPLGPLVNSIVNAPDTNEHDTQSTTAIVRIPGTSIVVVAFNNSAVYTGSNNHRTGWSRSTDDGTTWADAGSLPASTLGDGGDPVLARDGVSGQLYLSTKAFSGSAVQMFRSTDNGASWLAPVNAAPGFGGGDVLDTPWTTVDNFPGTGQGNVYVIARNFAGGGGGSQPNGTYVSRSTDGGATWGPSPGPFLSNIWSGPSLSVGLDHAVYAFAWASFSPPVIRLRKSTDFGATFGGFSTVANLTGTGINGDLGLGGGFRTNSYAQMAVNPVNGDLYVIYNDKAGSDKANVFFTASSNGAATWSAPFTLNNDGPYLTNKDQFMPTGAVTPDGKHLLATWYDRRSDASNSLIERWGIIGTISGGSLGAGGRINGGLNFRISTGSWPVVIGQDTYVGATYMGDYDQAAASNGFFYATWGDNRLPNAANTPLPHANQPDVRFARIPVSGPARGDLDRDFQTDRTIFRPSTGVWYSALTGGGATATGWGVSGDIDVQGDYDGDGKADIAVFRPSTGLWYILQSSNGAVRVVSWGTSGDIPLAGDVDGDGKDDLVIWRPSTGVWFANKSGGGTTVLGWGVTGDQPLLADFDGDGAKDFVIYRPSTGVWYIAQSSGGTPFIGWGTTGDVPVAGDFDGDGKADATVFRPSTGTWFIKKSSGGTIVTAWGVSGDIPVSGDWDGDGTSDVTVWRDSSGVWFSQLSSGGTAGVGWGVSGDKPSGRVPGS